jgi:flagellar hook-associated protein FlgK
MSVANRVSYKLVPETCPDIDRAADDFLSAVKKCTGNLRDSLTEKCQEVIDLEAEVNKLMDKIYDLENDVARLERELSAHETR